MFVSSYNTYVTTTSSEKLQKQDKENLKFPTFNTKLTQVSSANITKPSSYVFHNNLTKNTAVVQQKINNQQQTTNNPILKMLNQFNGKNSLMNAKSAYTTNAKTFSLITTPKTTLNQTPSLDNTLPQEPRDIKELNMRHKMVNTYLANENYYKVTA